MATSRFAGSCIVGIALVVAACAKDVQQKANTSAADSASIAAVPRPLPRNTGWDASTAGMFVVLSAADDMIDAALVLPDETDSSLTKIPGPEATAFSNTSVDVFNQAGLAGTSTLAVNPQAQPSEGCVVWPSVRLTSKPAKDWKVGLTTGKASAIPIRAIEELSSSDSSSSAIELVRLASEATATSGDPAFQGLPFAVRKGYQLSVGGDTVVLVGSVVRKINEEANPREEHLLLVGERIGSTGKYALAFQSRSAGAEDAIRTNAVLAAVRFTRTKQAAIILSFEYDDGGQIALLERIAPHDWKISWRSAYTGC